MPARWSLPGDHSAARAARRHVGEELAEWPQVDDIELVASELTTNAVRHGQPPIHLALDLLDGTVRVTVSNLAGDGEPAVQQSANDAGHGRGLSMVRALADDWGWSREGDRLHVWADFTPQN